MAHEPWRSLTIGGLITALNKDDPNSVISKASAEVNKRKAQLTDLFRTVDDFLNNAQTGVSVLKQAAESAAQLVDDLLAAISATGFYAVAIPGVIDRQGVLDGIAHALDDATDPKRPTLNGVTAASVVLLMVVRPYVLQTAQVTQSVPSNATQLTITEDRVGYDIDVDFVPTVEQVDANGTVLAAVAGTWQMGPEVSVFTPTNPADIQGKLIRISYRLRAADVSGVIQDLNELKKIFKGLQ